MKTDTPPIIGIITDCALPDSPGKPGFFKLYSTYAQSISVCGGMPLMIPSDPRLQARHDYLSMVRGLLFTGGGDIDPAEYGKAAERNHPTLRLVNPERTESEKHLYREAKLRGMPMLGICMGAQLMNVLEGGTLFVHLENAAFHRDAGSTLEKPNLHPVSFAAAGIFKGIFGKSRLLVVSSHHQGIEKLAGSLRPEAFSEGDGLIEGFCHGADPAIIGVQWHPEMLVGGGLFETEAGKLFLYFIEKAKIYKARF